MEISRRPKNFDEEVISELEKLCKEWNAYDSKIQRSKP